MDGQKKKIRKANERKGKVKGKNEEINGRGERGVPRPHTGDGHNRWSVVQPGMHGFFSPFVISHPAPLLWGLFVSSPHPSKPELYTSIIHYDCFTNKSTDFQKTERPVFSEQQQLQVSTTEDTSPFENLRRATASWQKCATINTEGVGTPIGSYCCSLAALNQSRSSRRRGQTEQHMVRDS